MHGHPKRKILYYVVENLVDENNHNSSTLYNEKLRQAVSKVMEETEAEFERLNEITMDNSFQYPIQKKDT